jgi:hypothetical protein
MHSSDLKWKPQDGGEQNTARKEIQTSQRRSSDVISEANINFYFLL